MCSENILQFYNFVSTYKDTDKKLRDMLKNATMVVDDIVERKPNIVDFVYQDQVKVVCEFKSENSNSDVDAKEFLSKHPVPDPIAVNWKCSECLKEFKTSRQFRNHTSRNHRLGKFDTEKSTVKQPTQCTISLDRFPSRKMLENHSRERHLHEQRANKGTNEYECDLCSKKFNTKNKIRQHLTTHNIEDRRKFLCVACGNQFVTKFGLNQHIRAIHDKEQRFQCTKCDRRFAHNHNLKTHMNRHNGIRPYSCKVCTKTFYDSSTLNVHTKSVHSATNAYVCSICSKAFNRNGNLKIHLAKTHQIQQTKRQGSVKPVKVRVE